MQRRFGGALFFGALMVTPALYALGEAVGGTLAAVLLPGTVLAASMAYAVVGGRKPPAGATGG